MLVKRSRYDALAAQYEALALAFNEMKRKWNALVERINAKGGEEFLLHAKMPGMTPEPFDQAEIKTLIKLCHPDKHGGSEQAAEITRKLLQLRR